MAPPLYDTTDLATLVQRERDFHPDKVLYLADKRQSLHFEQASPGRRLKAGIVRPETELEFFGFGTMNGKGWQTLQKPGLVRHASEQLIGDITEFVRKKGCGKIRS